MTSQPQPAPGDGRPVGQYLRPLRDLAAWALVLLAVAQAVLTRATRKVVVQGG